MKTSSLYICKSAYEYCVKYKFVPKSETGDGGNDKFIECCDGEILDYTSNDRNRCEGPCL